MKLSLIIKMSNRIFGMKKRSIMKDFGKLIIKIEKKYQKLFELLIYSGLTDGSVLFKILNFSKSTKVPDTFSYTKNMSG